MSYTTIPFSSILHNEMSFRHLLAADPHANEVTFTAVSPLFDSFDASTVFSNESFLEHIFSFLSMKDLWWKICFVCKCWFKLCLATRRTIDFDGHSIEYFLLNDKEIQPSHDPYAISTFVNKAFIDLMLHLCWTIPEIFGRVYPVCKIQTLKIRTDPHKDRAVTLRSEHLIELSRVHGQTLKHLCLEGRSMITREGLKQSFENLTMLESLSLEENEAMDHEVVHYVPTSLKRITLRNCENFLREHREQKEKVLLRNLEYLCCPMHYTEMIFQHVHSVSERFVLDWSKDPHTCSWNECSLDSNVKIDKLVLDGHQALSLYPFQIKMNQLEIRDRLVQAMVFACRHLHELDIPLLMSPQAKALVEESLNVLHHKELMDVMVVDRARYEQVLKDIHRVLNSVCWIKEDSTTLKTTFLLPTVFQLLEKFQFLSLSMIEILEENSFELKLFLDYFTIQRDRINK